VKLSAVVADPWSYVRRARPEPQPSAPARGKFEFIDSLREPYGLDPVVFGPGMTTDDSSESGRPA
jgi:hypothetical protein